jgi:hypothetical protein
MSLQGSTTFCGMFYVDFILFLQIKRNPNYSCHLDEYWDTCISGGFTPTPPKDWMLPLGWVLPNQCNLGGQ